MAVHTISAKQFRLQMKRVIKEVNEGAEYILTFGKKIQVKMSPITKSSSRSNMSKYIAKYRGATTQKPVNTFDNFEDELAKMIDADPKYNSYKSK